jgi:branched-chain amino acid transport system substrate-binding protein
MKKNLPFVLIFLVIIFSCREKEPLKIGFLGTLTGSFSDIGIVSRNAVTLAFEEVNQSGGIGGRPLELVVKDDMGDKDIAAAMVEELLKGGINIILGPTTSSIALSIIPFFSEEDLLFISSTVSTTELDNIDDNHLKFTTVSSRSQKLTNLLIDIEGINQVVFLNDLSNDSFARGYVKTFTPFFEKRGGTVLPTIDYEIDHDTSYYEIALEIYKLKPQGVIFLGDNRNSGLVCQQLAKLGYKGFLSSNAMTNDLILHGGSSVEGLMMISTYDPNNKAKEFLDLQANYRSRFGQDMNFAVKRNYEAARGLIDILRDNPGKTDSEYLKSAFLEKNQFFGVQGDLEMNEYGDVERPMYMFIINNGAIETLEETI